MSRQTELIISGHVQGVFFRASTQKQALQLSLKGFVCNLNNGRVKVVANGNPQNIQTLIAWCQHGPPTARVEKVKVSSYESTESYSTFEIR